MTNVPKPVSDEPSSPPAHASASPLVSTSFRCGPLLGCGVVLLAGLLTGVALETFFPVFDIPKELQNLPAPTPAELMVKHDQAFAVATRWNVTLTLGILAAAMASLLVIAESMRRGVGATAWWRAPLAATIAGLFGAAGGLLASLLLEASNLSGGMSPLARTISVQCLGLGLFGLGVGVGAAIASGSLRLLAGAAVGGICSGVFAGFLYPAGVGYLLPNAQTEHVIPIEAASRCIWLATVTVLTALVLTGLGAKGSEGRG